jgi:hypothetical protein
VSPDDMLHQQARSQQLLARAVVRIKQARPPADEIALEVRTGLPPHPTPHGFAGLLARP